MKVENTSLEGVKILTPPTLFEDFRGTYTEIYNQDKYLPHCPNFVQDDVSVSRRGVLRGIHGDYKTSKLVSCLYGAFYLVVIDYRLDGSQYGNWESFTITDKNRLQVYIPPGFGNGHLVLSDVAVFHYKQTQYYNRDTQFTIKWNDERFNIFWPMKPTILSERDSHDW